MIYVTSIVSSNGPGDVSSLPLLPGLFWSHFLPPNFLAGRHTKVAIHSIALSLALSPLRQQPCLKAQTTVQQPSHVQGGVLPELPCPHQLELSNHTRESSPCVLQVPLLFSKHPLIYMHVLVCFVVECENVCSQSCVLGWRLLVLPMG
jgi:hypothetical protein